MNDIATGLRRWTFGSGFSRSLSWCTPLLMGALLVVAGCGDGEGDDEGQKAPSVVDKIHFETESDSLTAEVSVELTEANWFDDGATFRGKLVGTAEKEGGGTETVTMNLSLYAPRGELVDAGSYTLMEPGTRRGDHATLSISHGQTARDLVDGTLILRAIAGDILADEVSEKVTRLSFTFEGNYTQRGDAEPKAIEGEVVFGS